VAAYKLLPGGSVSLEALLDQLGILLQRLISLESWYVSPRTLWNVNCHRKVPRTLVAAPTWCALLPS
jgi:hypothetical protein